MELLLHLCIEYMTDEWLVWCNYINPWSGRRKGNDRLLKFEGHLHLSCNHCYYAVVTPLSGTTFPDPCVHFWNMAFPHSRFELQTTYRIQRSLNELSQQCRSLDELTVEVLLTSHCAVSSWKAVCSCLVGQAPAWKSSQRKQNIYMKAVPSNIKKSLA